MTTYYTLNCDECKKEFQRSAQNMSRHAQKKNTFCSRECSKAFMSHKIQIKCSQCGVTRDTILSQHLRSKSGESFCSRSCSAKFNSKYRKGTRRSKCETLLFNMLVDEFPQLEILSNDRLTLNGLELDISIPSLKLAIEWNGIVHYKPIYGQAKLDKIQDKDIAKLQLANKLDINLIVIPDLVSTELRVKEAFEKIKTIINGLL